MSREGVDEDESTRNVGIEHRNKILRERVGQIGDELLPGIPDAITVDLIAPKLPWIDCQTLWAVSHAWQRVIQNREIYDARVRSQSTEAFVMLKNEHLNNVRSIAVHSVSDGSWYSLPPIPGILEGMPWSCHCVSLDCKLYVLGGYTLNYTGQKVASAIVYVLDLAGQRQWKECAGMKDRREEFGCGAMNGKIYVFGGICEHDPVWGSEVYDPETDSWSPIAPISTFGVNLKTTTVGDELFVYNRGYSGAGMPWAEVYHPLKDEWRSVERQLIRYNVEAPLPIGGKLHKFSPRGILVFNVCKGSWKPLHRFPVGRLGLDDSCKIAVLAAVAVNDEVLVTVRCQIHGTEDGTGSQEIFLMRSQGLGCKDKKIIWERTQRSLNFTYLSDPFLCLIHL